jgi:hypothetical protein
MKNFFPVLALLAGLGSSISFAQTAPQTDPFHKYLSGIRVGKPETALVRFAGQCKVDIQSSKHHFAQLPGEKWKEVKSLAHALSDQETDGYVTAAVWTQGQRVLVELWDLDLELGSQRRQFFCLDGGQIQAVEQIDWQYFEGEDLAGPIKPHWLGYEQRWKRNSTARYSVVLLRYVNQLEHSVPKPVDENQVPETGDVWPKALTWKDLKMPDSLLR